MANTMRWRYGDTNTVIVEARGNCTIEIGDFVFFMGSEAVTVSLLLGAKNLAENQRSMRDLFLGVAMQASSDIDDVKIRVATTGVFEFPCPLGVYQLGDCIGPGAAEVKVGQENQIVSKVEKKGLAIAMCAKGSSVATERILIDIRSVLMGTGIA